MKQQFHVTKIHQQCRGFKDGRQKVIKPISIAVNFHSIIYNIHFCSAKDICLVPLSNDRNIPHGRMTASLHNFMDVFESF